MLMVPHDPANQARLSYVWRDSRYHLIDKGPGGTPLVVLISDTISEGKAYPTPEAAEDAFWDSIVTTILAARTYQDPHASWRSVELAAVPDPESGQVHVVERSAGTCKAWQVTAE
jgi:hypothetical protein